MFAPNLRPKIFGWLERLKNSAEPWKNRRRRGACIQRGGGGWGVYWETQGSAMDPGESVDISNCLPGISW